MMKIVERQVGDVVILSLHGRFVIHENEEALYEAVNRLTGSGKAKFLVNLADVPRMDSAGLGELVRVYSSVSRIHGRMKLLKLTKKVRDLLSLTRLLAIFETFESEDEAIQSF